MRHLNVFFLSKIPAPFIWPWARKTTTIAWQELSARWSEAKLERVVVCIYLIEVQKEEAMYRI